MAIALSKASPRCALDNYCNELINKMNAYELFVGVILMGTPILVMNICTSLSRNFKF